MENIAKGQKLSRGEAFDTVRPPRHVVRVRWQDVRVARRERQLGYVWGTLSGLSKRLFVSPEGCPSGVSNPSASTMVSRTLKVRGGIISQANRYLGDFCSSQRLFEKSRNERF